MTDTSFGMHAFGPADALLQAQKTAQKDLENTNIDTGSVVELPEEEADSALTSSDTASADDVESKKDEDQKVLMPAPASSESVHIDDAEQEPKAHKKRGRKPKNKDASNFSSEEDHDSNIKSGSADIQLDFTAETVNEGSKSSLNSKNTGRNKDVSTRDSFTDVLFQNEHGDTISYNALVDKIEQTTGRSRSDLKIYVKPSEARIYYISDTLIGSIPIF